MAKRTKRGQIKRQLAQAHNALERTNYLLGSVHLEFAGVKEDYADYLVQMMTMGTQLQEHIRKFWTLAWGKAPDDLNTWR